VDSKSNWIGLWVDADFFRPPTLRKILSVGGFCAFPEGAGEPEGEKMMQILDAVHGHYIFGKQVVKDNFNGILLSGAGGNKAVDLMVPWKFVHTMFLGSAEQVRKFGFVKE